MDETEVTVGVTDCDEASSSPRTRGSSEVLLPASGLRVSANPQSRIANPGCSWDYTALAADYDHRPDYDVGLIRELLARVALRDGDRVLDVGAGTGKLTAPLCTAGADVIACEPNPAMRAIGARKQLPVVWIAGSGEALPVSDGAIALVAYGSSFNVLSPAAALAECARVLRPQGHWLAMWNHRDLDDPLQRDVEALIRRRVPDYDYGRRRQDPSDDLRRHGGFDAIEHAARRFVVTLPAIDWLAAWRSHGTLARQAGAAFAAVLADLHALVAGESTLAVPYATRAWLARRCS